MKIYTRKNAAVGYVTLKAIQRSMDRKRKRRSGFKVAAYVGLGLVSAGILAAALAIALRRRSGEADEIALEAESENEIVGEYVTAPEPIPAT
jgi:mannose/fructose/N-acetylgalactosamine-specific phosphotransferase system component IIC